VTTIVEAGPPRKDNQSQKPNSTPWWRILGPGLITGASDDDPSGIATYSQTGAEFGYATNWTLLFSYPLMVAIQIISARVGRTTGRGIAGNLRSFFPFPLVCVGIGLLLIANVINIGADIGAMADAVRLLVGGPYVVYIAAFAFVCVVSEIFMAYKSYARLLKWLTFALFAYFFTLFFAKVDFSAFARGLFIPKLSFDRAYLTAIVAIFGTTISPYLFFWQASQEVEEIEAKPDREALKDAPSQAPAAQHRINLDTFIGMAFSNIVALAIMTSAAATLNATGKTDIQTSAQAAEALRPVAGVAAEFIFAAGIVGTGLLAVPVLAGSAAYAIGEALKWPVGLDRKPREAKAFYATIAVSTLVGLSVNMTRLDPIQSLFWSAVINGVIAVPIMAATMAMAGSAAVMGKQKIRGLLRFFGWLATAVMAIIAAAMLITML
jgi:NRAMP (natural resistance-associated macrophage protein)-like metal ion transporter